MQKTIAYTFDTANVLITENDERTHLLYTFSRNENKEYQMIFEGKKGTLLSTYPSLKEDVISQLDTMSAEYDKTPFIRNLKQKKKKISAKTAEKRFTDLRLFPLDNSWLVSVVDSQDRKTLEVNREYYLMNQKFSYLIHEETARQADLHPAEKVIEEKKTEWIERFEEEISNCVYLELQNISEYTDKAVVMNGEYGIIAYENGEFRCYSLIDGEYNFFPVQTLSKCYADMYKMMETALKKSEEKTHLLKMRKVLNRCRKHISQNHKYQFMAEMGILKGMMEAFEIKNLQKALPEEYAVATYLDKYSDLESKEKETFDDDDSVF